MEGNEARYGERYLDRLHEKALLEDAEGVPRPSMVPPAPFVPPGPPVPPSAPVLSQKERTRRLHDDLAGVINRHAASPETVLMALELLRHQVLAPRLRQIELE